MSKQDELLKKLLATFKVEAEEHLRAISSGLVELEKELSFKERAGIVETIYREAHSLKGAARAVNLSDIETACQSLESVFARFKKSEIKPPPELFDALHKIVDAIAEFVVTPGEKGKAHISALLKDLTNLAEGKGAPPSDDRRAGVSQVPEAKIVSSRTVRIPTERLDSLLLQAEEMLSAKLAAKRRASALLETAAGLDSWTKEWAKIQPEVRNADRISGQTNAGREKRQNGLGPTVGKLLEFLEWNRSYINSFRGNLEELAQSAETDARLLDRMVEHLLEDMKQVLMLPFSSLLQGFPKMVRDLSREAGKETELVIEGSEVEIDKRILEEMKDPLTHLLRNCVDHGVEKPVEREALGKLPRGRIAVAISQINSSKVEVLVSDDGAGIDFDNVRAAAVKAGIVSEEEARNLDEDGVLSLIYQSGVSTSPMITDVSGRGLGLAIVREKVEKLGGTMSMETEPAAGTSLRILLPLTLSAFRGVLIRADGQAFIVPTASVERVLRLKREEIKTVENRDTIELNGDVLSLVRLDDVLELPRKPRGDEVSEYVTAMVLGAAGTHIAFSVDGILGEQEVLIKNLGRQLSRVRNIAGAMVQSSGEVVPILNVLDLLKSAVGVSARVEGAAVAEEPETREAQSILIVEDSITSRTLLKNILESSGYRVKTAVDGVDAMTALKAEDFDLVVSDIDMPRMDGFDLTAKIRGDEKLSELPLVLVTSLESREHRERGVEVGANAYIAKSSFDQSNLLETIERLI